ncbi:hypothetical protein AB0O07_16295 [Streptomyces sp. NPDC093085]|uniref:hypothetical protein n=1 Tax=Streptomyces sp. NPDC093085 TaxID=3155068 RepID=UPI003418ED9C
MAMTNLLPMIAVAVLTFLWSRHRTIRARVRQSARSIELGLLPMKRLDADYSAPPPPELTDALAAARSGEWEAAASLLAGTGTEWERRSWYANALGSAAAKSDGWLVAWETARPDDPDAAVVRAQSTVALAWERRGSGWARRTSPQQFEDFHRTLARSRQEIARAAELNPQDPTPYLIEIWAALGLGYPHEEMHRIWAEVKDRAPDHYQAHYSALQYWCAKWRGSHELARSFAIRAAADAPLGSLLSALPLLAWFEADIDDSMDASAYRSPALTALVDAALADTAAAAKDHPHLAEVRHLLAHFLAKQGRHEAALEQFRLVDGYVAAVPWVYFEDVRRAYTEAREKTVRATA